MYAKQWKIGGKNSMPLFSPVQKGFLELFELAFHFPFKLIPKKWMPDKNQGSHVGRWGVLDEWGKRVKKKERKDVWGIKKG